MKEKMKNFTTQKWITLVAVLVILNGLFWSGVVKDSYEAKWLDEKTDLYEADIVEITDSSRRTRMTHLLTMDAFLDDVEVIFNEQQFPEGVTAMIAFDGDNMGKKNEQYGSGTADRLAVAFANTVKKHFPDNDVNLVTNVGEKSDEFYMLLRGRESREALIKEIEDFQEDIRKQKVKSDDGTQEISGTVSIGIAFYDGKEDFETLFDAADQAAYEAKEAGKDCYFVAED